MSIVQDPTSPTGISHDTPRGNSEVARAISRKANAAIELAASGKTWDAIANILGYPDGQTAQASTELALERGLFSEQSQEFMRQKAGKRLEKVLRSCYPQATNPNHPDHLAYAREVRAGIKDHAELFGYKAPARLVVDPDEAKIRALVDAVRGKEGDVETGDIFSDDAHGIEDAVVIDADGNVEQ